MRKGLRRYPFVKWNGTKDIAESPTRRETPKKIPFTSQERDSNLFSRKFQ